MERQNIPHVHEVVNEEGFTLIELTIVVALVGIIATIAIPTYGAIQDLARLNALKSSAASLISSLSSQQANGASAQEVIATFETMNSRSDHILLSAGYTDNEFDGLHPSTSPLTGRWCVIATWIEDPAAKPAGTIDYVNQYGNGAYGRFRSGPGTIFDAWAAWSSYGGIKTSSDECTITLPL